MRSRRTLGMAALISVLLGVPVVAMADTTQPYIVVFRDSAISRLGSGGQVDKARVGQLVRDIAGSQRIAIGNVYDSALGGFSARLSPAQVAALASEPSIGSITPDVPVQLADGLAQETIVSLAEPRIPAGVRRVGATQNDDAAINGKDGRVDVDIAIIDTGIEKDHPDLNVAGGYNCTSSDRGKWNDGWGHGTHVAGIVGALDNGRGVVGVAPGARLWALKVLDNSGNGLMSWIVCGIDWITAQRASSDPSRPRIEVANMSLRANLPDGGNDGNCGRTIRDAMHAAICRSVAAGTMYVVAAGNDARNANRYRPSSYQEALTVSALADYDGKPGGDGTRPQGCGAGYPDDAWAGFSNYGDVVDLIAPGICVLSTWAGGRYAYASGTSMAAPHVAGVAGLYLVRHPGASPEQVRMALRNSGRTDWKRATDPDGDPEKMVWATGFSRPPDFAVHASAPTSYAGAGSELAVEAVIDRSSGHDAPVRLTVEGLPPALSAAAVKTSGDRATVYVQVAGWAASGRYDATLVGSDGGVTRKSSFEILIDSAAPSASFGAPAAPARIQQHLSARVSWSESDSGGSGVGGRTLWRQRSSPVTPGSCSGLSFYNVGEARTAKDEYIDSLYNGYCYRWNLSVRDRAGNRTTVISGTVLVDTTMPSRPSATVVGSTSSVDDPSGVSLPSAYVDAEGTLWLRGGGSGTVDLRVEATDNQSGVTSITLEPSTDAAGWTLPSSPLRGGSATARLKYGAKAVALALSIRATNGAGERGNAATLRFAPDGKAPTAATWRHPASQLAYTWDGEVDLIWSGGSDAGSGLAAEQLVRRERAPVTSTGGCGSFSPAGDPRLLANGYSETGLLSNYCYRWRLRTTDRVGNLADPVVSGKVLVDKVAPKVTVERPVVGKTSVKDVTTQVVEWSASDSGGSRMASVRVQRQKSTTHKAGTCDGATWKNDGLSRLATSPIKETGLTLGACYRWIVTATDKATNSTAATSGSVLISTAGSSEDPAPPPSGAPSVGTVTLTLAAGTQLTSTGMAWLDARWTASGGGSSLTGYELRLSSSGGTNWNTFSTPNGATPSMALRLPAGRTYLLSVRARNSAGQWSSWSDARSYTVGLSQAEASSAYEKVGTWKSVSLSGASGGAVSSSSSSGAIIRYHFTARGVALVATRGPDRGRADVYVDGYRVATIDLYSPTLTMRQVVFTRSWSSSGSHVVSLQIRSGRIDLDAAVVVK